MRQTIGGQVTRYLLDVQPGLWQVLASTTGADTTRYVHGPTGTQQQQNPSNAWVSLVQDGLGSVRGVANAANGILESRHYDPYGQPRGSYDDTPFGFTGEPTDGNELVYLRARYYHPALAGTQGQTRTYLLRETGAGLYLPPQQKSRSAIALLDDLPDEESYTLVGEFSLTENKSIQGKPRAGKGTRTPDIVLGKHVVRRRRRNQGRK